MNDTNDEPTETFSWDWHEFPEEFGINNNCGDDVEKCPDLKWVVQVYGKQEWCNQTYAGTLEEPPEYQSKDEFDHCELHLAFKGEPIWSNTEYEPDDIEVINKVDSVDWSQVF